MSSEEKSFDEYVDMQSLIDDLGEEYLDKPLPEGYTTNIYAVTHEYKGLEVTRNIDRNNGTRYYTIRNLKNDVHIHVQGKNKAHRVCDCFDDMINDRDLSKYQKSYRKNALALMGYNIKSIKNK